MPHKGQRSDYQSEHYDGRPQNDDGRGPTASAHVEDVRFAFWACSSKLGPSCNEIETMSLASENEASGAIEMAPGLSICLFARSRARFAKAGLQPTSMRC